MLKGNLNLPAGLCSRDLLSIIIKGEKTISTKSRFTLTINFGYLTIWYCCETGWSQSQCGGSPVADKRATDQSQGALGVSGKAAYAHNVPVYRADLSAMV